MRKFITKKLIAATILLSAFSARAQNNFFSDAKENSFVNAAQKRVIVPSKYRTVSLDTLSLIDFLKTVPLEKNAIVRKDAPVIKIPMPDGKISSFHIWETSVMEPGLAKKFPNIKTYTGQGIEDRSAIIKIDRTESGFHAMILSPVTTSVFLDPYAQGNKTNYISYFRSDLKNTEAFKEETIGTDQPFIDRPAINDFENIGPCIGTQLRSYRLAVACTHQYAIAATGLSNPTVAQVLAAIVTSINRIDGVYEQELDIHFNLVAKEDTIIFTSAANDLFTSDNNPNILVSQSQSIIDSRIGDANYDIGHTFCTGGGGATLTEGIVCISGEKASCETGLSNPVGDAFNIDYVAHEIGHEFGAFHSFNSNQGYCVAPGQWFATSNAEPGSGTTIMCYAEGAVASPSSLCGTDNLQEHSDPDFNALGFDQIIQYSTNGSGNNCAVVSVLNNTPPIVYAGSDFTIPKSTPFILTGSATDAENDILTYSWEEVNLSGPECRWNQPSGDAPIFRSFPPVTSPSRYFPKLSDVINNTTTIGELLPSYGRILHFRLTVRDNHAGGGGICNDENIVTVDNSSGPFVITYPDAATVIWNAGDSQTVAWNTAGTQLSPVNCNNVLIELSVDGGLTYPDTLLSSAPNTGVAKIKVPNDLTATARIRVMAVGNIFYDISNNNFIIQSPRGAQCPSANLLFASDVTGNSYQWQVNNGNGYTNIMNDAVYTGTTTNTLQLTDPPTAWYGYQYQCVVTGSAGISNSTAITLKFAEEWLGARSTAWEDPLNWGCGIVPDANTDVLVNSGVLYFPVVNSNEAVRSLTVSPDASCTVSPNYNITITH